MGEEAFMSEGEEGSGGEAGGKACDEGEGQEGELALEAEAAARTMRNRLRMEKLNRDMLADGERASWQALVSAYFHLRLEPPDVAIHRASRKSV
jgi:hypothetical protein